MIRNNYLAFALGLLSLVPAVAQDKDLLLKTLEEELGRETQALSKASIPPYYIDYRVDEAKTTLVSASFGSLTNSSSNMRRLLTTRVRVGSYDVDNTHPLKERFAGGGFGGSYLPIEDNPEAIKFFLWRATQNEYKQALEAYKTIKSAEQPEKDKDKSPIPDFSKEQPVPYVGASPAEVAFNKEEWEAKLRAYSRLFLNVPDVMKGDVTLQLAREKKYFVSSEGASQVQYFTYAYLYVSASVRADDNDLIPLHRSFFAPLPSGLPDDKVITDEIKSMISTLAALKKAPLAEPYTGPAILDARVGGVFFHEIFGHRVEGHRLKSDQDGQTFKAKIGESVLLESLNVSFDPTLQQFEGRYLNGTYLFDDEGTKARRVNVVEKGILKTFLMSRTPLKDISHSNGHARAAGNSLPVSRQSNLIVETLKPRSSADLRQMLIKECKKQDKKYGYLFKDVVGGFTLTGRFVPNAFNIFPTEVYRVYVDGRPDELVRGVDLIGTPLAMFAEIAAAGDKRDIFTGFCGAESGYVPVSAISPSLFVRRIETQKKPVTSVDDTLLSEPASTENNNE